MNHNGSQFQEKTVVLTPNKTVSRYLRNADNLYGKTENVAENNPSGTIYDFDED